MPRELVEMKEETIMQQAIIKMGFILPVFRKDELYNAACVFDDILGGYPESRLFQEIREKQGLCYDISSSYDPYKGVLTISSGVDVNQLEVAISSIKSLVEELKLNGITAEELKHAKAYFIHQMKSSIDNQSVSTKRLFLSHLLGYDETIEQRLFLIDQTTVDQVNQIGQMMTLDTIYVLHGGQK
jgi:predicted Zn-dependent peptidase